MSTGLFSLFAPNNPKIASCTSTKKQKKSEKYGFNLLSGVEEGIGQTCSETVIFLSPLGWMPLDGKKKQGSTNITDCSDTVGANNSNKVILPTVEL